MAAVLRQLPQLRRAAAAGLLALCAAAAAQTPGVSLAGRMGERALFIVDGVPQMLAVGQSTAGLRFRRWVGDRAEVERAGATSLLTLGGAPATVGAGAAPVRGREVVITAGPGGHFSTAGAINGRAVRFMVDTGATLVSIGLDDAVRLGIDLAGARAGVTQTANGAVPVQLVTLNLVRVGDVELANVPAAVVPQPMPMVLLGNSFLSRLQMRRDNDVMRLELR